MTRNILIAGWTLILLWSLPCGLHAFGHTTQQNMFRNMTTDAFEPKEFAPRLSRSVLERVVHAAQASDGGGLRGAGENLLTEDAFPALPVYVTFNGDDLVKLLRGIAFQQSGVSASQEEEPVLPFREIVPVWTRVDEKHLPKMLVRQSEERRLSVSAPVAEDAATPAAARIAAPAVTARATFSPPERAVLADTLAHWLDEGRRVFLVDIRQPEDFEVFRIPGAMNIPLFAVKTKPFLRSAPVVLLDEGHRPQQSQQACERLRQAGIDAWFLFGGLSAWRDAGHSIQGDVFAQRQLNRLSPRDVMIEQSAWKTWTVLDVSGAEAAGHLPLQTIPVPFEDDRFRFQDALRQVFLDLPAGQPVLVTNQQGEGYDELDTILDEMNIRPVFFLEGGAAAYREFSGQEQLIRNHSWSEKTIYPNPVSCASEEGACDD